MWELEKVLFAVCSYYKISRFQLFMQTRRRDVSEKRHLFLYLAKNLTPYSNKSIGDFCKKNGSQTFISHCMIIYAEKKISDLKDFDIDPQISNDISNIKDIIKYKGIDLIDTNVNLLSLCR
tara:strand:+ start:1307 stop:1669 length:363 start_codon:yes stop_codon:yes gene_type:complete